MTITTTDQLLAAPKITLPFLFANIAGQAAGNIVSLWRATGFPAQSAIPSTPAVPTGVDSGFAFPNPTSPAKTHLHKIQANGATPGMLVLFDRLSHMGGLAGNSTASQAVSTAAIDRGDTSGAGVEAYLEWYTATGGTVSTATVTWTSSDGTGGQSSAITLAATRPVGFMAQIPLVTGTLGVQSVQSVQLSASTGTAGNFGVTLCRRIAEYPIAAANTPPLPLDPLTLGIPTIDDDACLFLVYQTSGTGTGVMLGSITLAQG